ncbi:MAG: glycosyltransferase family 39 protein [Anaerolineae bacterium]
MQNVRALPTTLEIARAHARSSTSIRSNVLVGVLLLGIMLIGGYFRFVGLNWDDFTHLHPDERFLTGVASSLGGMLNLTEESDSEKAAILEDCLARNPDTGGVGGYFDTHCSTLNPHNTGNSMYVYGTLPLFMARGAAEITRSASEWWASIHGDPGYDGSVWTDYYGVHLVWRTVSALAEMGAVFLVFLIGLKLYDRWIGLLAAFLYSAAVFSIQLAHFGTADAVGNLFCTLAILLAVLAQKEGKLSHYIWFGVALGAALASRINLAPLAALIVLAAAIRALPALHRSVAWGERERLIAEAVIGVALAGVFTLLAFRVFNPYTFNGPGFFGLSINQRWLDDLAKSRDFVSGAIDFPPNYQWASRTQWIYPLKDMVLWGMGVAFGLVGWVAFAFAGWRIIRGRSGALLNALPFAWVLMYFGYMGAQWVMVIRYFIPLYPSLAVLAAWGLITLLRNARIRKSAWRTVLAWGLIGVTAGFTLLWAAMYTNVYRHQLTRVQASYWVWENVPSDFAMRINDAPANTPLVQIALPQCSGSDNLLQKATCFNDLNRRWSSQFVAPASGEVTELYAPHLGNPLDTDQEETLRFTVFANDQPTELLVDTTFTSTFPRTEHVLGNAYTIPLDEPLHLDMGQHYTMNVELLTGDALVSGGSVFSWEGAWDDPVPIKVCEMPVGTTLADEPPPGLVSDPRECNGLDPWWGLVNGYELNIVYEDQPEKRQNLITYLNDSDFIAISSNRFYDSMSRNTQRWPMTQVYYQALLDGSLGFDLVAQFDETFELGPLRVSDQYLPNYTSSYMVERI